MKDLNFPIFVNNFTCIHDAKSAKWDY